MFVIVDCAGCSASKTLVEHSTVDVPATNNDAPENHVPHFVCSPSLLAKGCVDLIWGEGTQTTAGTKRTIIRKQSTVPDSASFGFNS